MKKFASEKAFTLVEMSVVLSVVALIGSMMVGGLVASNRNRVDANVLEFFDQVIEQAYENFKISPTPILKNDVSLPEPYQTMQYSQLTEAEPGFQYTGFYTENLIEQNGISTEGSKYMLSIRFIQEPGTEEEIDFTSEIISYDMEAKVVELKDGAYDYDTPLLERVFKGIAADRAVPSGTTNTVTYRAVTGDVTSAKIQNFVTGETGNNTLTTEFFTGDSFYSQRVSVTEHNGDKAFVGWSADPASREVIPQGTKITADMQVYAIYSDYRVEFQLQNGQQFDPSLIAPNDYDKSYFVEKDFEEGQEQTTIKDMISGNTEAERIVTGLLGDPDGQVIDDGYVFKGWRDAITKDPISESLGGPGLDTVLRKDGPYLQLEAVMEKIDADRTEALKLELDLSNLIEAGRKFYVYGISDLDYKIAFVDKDGQKQLAVIMEEITSWNGQTKSVKHTFTVGDGKLTIKDGNGKKYSDTAEYFKAIMQEQPGSYNVLDRINLSVSAPSFNSGEYRQAAETFQDNVTFNGVKVTSAELQKLDADSDTSGQMEYKTTTADGVQMNLPMDETAHEELQSYLLNLYGQNKDSYAQLTVQNVGSITHSSSIASSVSNRDVTITSVSAPSFGFSTREVSIQIVVPFSFLKQGTWRAYDLDVSLGVESKTNEIYVRLGGKLWQYRNRPGAMSQPLYGNSYDSYEKIMTGIPYTEVMEYNNKDYTIYNRIQTITIVPDFVDARSGGLWVNPKVTLRDGIYGSLSSFVDNDGSGEKPLKAIKAQGVGLGYVDSKQIAAGHPNNWSVWFGSQQLTRFKPGFFNGLTKGEKVSPANQTPILQTSYADSSRIQYAEGFKGDWAWGDTVKNQIKNSFTSNKGDGSAFDTAWKWAMDNGITITSATPGSTTSTKQTYYGFNFKDGYTSLPSGFVCTEKKVTQTDRVNSTHRFSEFDFWGAV